MTWRLHQNLQIRYTEFALVMLPGAYIGVSLSTIMSGGMCVHEVVAMAAQAFCGDYHISITMVSLDVSGCMAVMPCVQCFEK